MTNSGKHFLDGMDIWNSFGMFVESGSDDFLKFPDRKDSITHDWMDSNGIDVDLSRVFFKDETITLKMAQIADNEADFWAKRNAFLAQWAQPGTHRWTVAEFSQDFQVYYKSCTTLTRFSRIKDSTKVAIKFTIVLNLPGPAFDNNAVFIVDEDGRFLVT